jgi:hypothetical protein
MKVIKRETNSGAGQQNPIYELRLYHACEGKLTDLVDRFRNHTIRLFKKHGMKDLAFWLPVDEPLKGRALVYILEHKSQQAASESWKALIEDPEWREIAANSERNGKLVEAVDSTFMDQMDLSRASATL